MRCHVTFQIGNIGEGGSASRVKTRIIAADVHQLGKKKKTHPGPAAARPCMVHTSACNLGTRLAW